MASSLEDDLCCPVCTDIYIDPVLLSCSHSFCKSCVQRSWASQGSRVCPICRRTNPQEEPPVNRVLRNLCERFVQERSQRGALCRLHGDKLRLFCHDDKALVCFTCRDSRLHKGQRFSPFGEVAADRKEELKVKLSPLKKKLEVFKKQKLACDETAKHIKTQVQHTEKQIKKEFEELHQFLRDEEAARIAALRKEEEQKSKTMKEKIDKMNREITFLSDTIRVMQKKMQADDITFLQNYKRTVEQTWLQGPNSHIGALINVAKHLGNLKFRVWEKMKTIVQYTPVILDPNTAYPELILSEDLTSVRLGNDIQQLPDNPERFDYRQCLLGSEGFNSGTHCWDVEVAYEGTFWSVGVILESIPRKGEGNSLIGDWSVTYMDSQLYQWSTPQHPTILTLARRPKRIRVQLDWNRGMLTFSDSDSNTHLHTFRHTFTERVFPYLCTNNKVSPLRILPVKTSVKVEQHSYQANTLAATIARAIREA
ncbi:zinc-binding protein A33-like [Engraulis encrasicolus]|uniref:zinc-binding protein A33-like n=1 Tax=Engraulis encrasicolus TaxID=184585 RepID=UPI002FCFE8B7